jgi:periplasmic protein TonB
MVAGRFQVISVLAGKVKNRLRSEELTDFFECPPPRQFTGVTPGPTLPPVEPAVRRNSFLGPLALFFSIVVHGAIVVYAMTLPLVSSPAPLERTAMLLNVQLVDPVAFDAVEQVQQVEAKVASVPQAPPPEPQTTATLGASEEIKVLSSTETSAEVPQESSASATADDTRETPRVGSSEQVLTDPPESDNVVDIGVQATKEKSNMELAGTEEPISEEPSTEPATPDYKPPQNFVAPDNAAPPRIRHKHRHSGVSHVVTTLQARPAVKPVPRNTASTYRDSVMAHLAMNKPSGGSGSGTVAVAFSLSNAGELLSARVVRSSGNRILEQKVLNAVRNASPYPQPPLGVKRSQLLFNIPFYFQ